MIDCFIDFFLKHESIISLITWPLFFIVLAVTTKDRKLMVFIFALTWMTALMNVFINGFIKGW
jgi:hypothetical protein